MQSAYLAAAKLARRAAAEDRPEDVEHLRDTQVVVVSGLYDRGETVFERAGIPVTTIQPKSMARRRLDPDQILFVNCPGQLTPAGLRRVEAFVRGGGLLVTTDWALKNVLEKAFPGYVEANGRNTKDDVVRVEFRSCADTFLEGLLDPDDDPLWWLEGSSYPIRVLDDSVTVLASSREMGRRYGDPAVAVSFEVDAGKVYHLTSHFYLQRTETRTARDRDRGLAFLRKKCALAEEILSAEERSVLDEVNYAQAQSAYTSTRALLNLVIEQGRRAKARKR
ncbi:MAG: hypothetical protein D6731_23665 [Planctomycetota bacterium]|nr:MAG: hypothetical protein D6731_23665 [Planctomycetota bacterium]